MAFPVTATTEYQTAMALPYKERPVGTTPPSCDLSFLIRHLFPQGCFSDGFVTIMMRDPNGMMHRVTTKPASLLPEFCERSLYFGKNADYYISKASFVSPFNCSADNALGYDFIAVEVDCHKQLYSQVEMDTRCTALVDSVRYELVDEGRVPAPNAAIFSGRGIHLLWLCDHADASQSSAIKQLVKQFADQIDALLVDPFFKGFEIDRGYCTNSSGLMRLPGSINPKTGTEVQYELYHTDRITIPENRQIQKSEKNLPGDLSSNLVHFSGATRLRSLLKLISIRNGDCTGLRDKTLLQVFCAAQYAGLTNARALSIALEANKLFIEPLPESQVAAALTTAARKRYHYKDATIALELGITDAEKAAIGWHAYTGKNAHRDAARKKAKDARIAEILALYNEGLSISEISRRTGHSRNTIAKYIRQSMPSESSAEKEPSSPSASPQNPSAEAATQTPAQLSSVYPAQIWSLDMGINSVVLITNILLIQVFKHEYMYGRNWARPPTAPSQKANSRKKLIGGLRWLISKKKLCA